MRIVEGKGILEEGINAYSWLALQEQSELIPLTQPADLLHWVVLSHTLIVKMFICMKKGGVRST
jgi:hypothetical protein